VGGTQPPHQLRQALARNQATPGERLRAPIGGNRSVCFHEDDCDRRVFEHTLADTLVWTWRGYRPE
ncbi:MAG: hypothetical protein ACXW3Z_08225, partial [Limisphaerales bacterium]